MTKPEGAASYLSGSFDITKGGIPAEGTFEVELLQDTWKVVVPSQDDEGNTIFISLTRESNGAGVGRVYGSKDDKVNYADKKGEFSWGDDRKVQFNSKTTDLVMPL